MGQCTTICSSADEIRNKFLIFMIYVLLILLVLLAAFLVSKKIGGARTISGGGGAQASVFHNELYTESVKRVIGNIKGNEDPSFADVLPIIYSKKTCEQGSREFVGGGKSKARESLPKQCWTKYKTWIALEGDKGAKQQYFNDREEVLNGLVLDWSDVRTSLAKKIDDDREWAGRINIVNGKPKVVECVSSPYRIGENVNPGVLAMIPADTINRLSEKPAMFLFHTHPGKSPGSGIPSDTDIVTGLSMTYLGWTAGHLVVSHSGIILYGVGQSFMKQVWSDAHPHWIAMRKIFDVLTGLMGRRSWRRWWRIRDIEEFMQRYDVMFISFPTDAYARDYYKNKFQIYQGTDFEQLDDYREELETQEKRALGCGVLY